VSDMIYIDKERDIILIEKCETNEIIAGSKFYCGVCGNVLGNAISNHKFPFTTAEFSDNIENTTFFITKMGLHHKTCGHTMFSLKKEYDFMSLENYNKAITQNL